MNERFSREQWIRRSGYTVVTPTEVLIWHAFSMGWQVYRRSNMQYLGMSYPDHD
jgi:hypothetical protein